MSGSMQNYILKYLDDQYQLSHFQLIITYQNPCWITHSYSWFTVVWIIDTNMPANYIHYNNYNIPLLR